MYKKIICSIFCILFFYELSGMAYAQAPADSLKPAFTAYNNTINRFYATIGSKSGLYNGREYKGEYPGVTGNANFNDTTNWVAGNVMYDGYLYQNVKIKYDLYKDLVVIPLYNSYLKLSLINEKLNWFEILGHHFSYIKKDSSTVNPIAAGIYDILYNGKIQLLCKRSKSLQQENTNNNITSYFKYEVDYYLFKNNKYYLINSQGEFLDVLKDKKKDIEQFIKSYKLKFKKAAKEQTIAKIAEYYDHITG